MSWETIVMNKPINVEELPESQLKQSPTYLCYQNACGSCNSCGEMTSPLNPCCDSPVHFEGGTTYFNDLWAEIEKELKQVSEDL